jgi:hypothetical protein
MAHRGPRRGARPRGPGRSQRVSAPARVVRSSWAGAISVVIRFPVFVAKQSPPPTGAVTFIGEIPRAGSGHNEREWLRRAFREQVDKWKAETQHWSSVTRMLAHPSYLRIVGLARESTGNEIERLLLHELEANPDYWFYALTAVTGEDPVRPQDDFDGAVHPWLEWGRRKGYIAR